MHLIINTLSVTLDGGGIKTYLYNIISSLASHSSQPQITLICSRSNREIFKEFEQNKNVHIKSIPFPTDLNIFRILLDQVFLPILLFLNFKNNENILITPSSIATIFSPLKQVTIIQAPLVLKNIRNDVPDEYLKDLSTSKKMYYDFFLPLTLKKSDAIITVSQYLKRKLLKFENVDEAKTHVVYEGVEVGDSTDIPSDSAQKTELLFVSTLYSYKNADKVIKAFSELKKQVGIPNFILRIIGNDPTGGERLTELRELAEKLNVSNSVIFDGYVPHEKIDRFYKKALVFIFPSSVETFGLPPLEAMAVGVPVVVSNRMSVPEVVGEAGLIIDPDDSGSLQKAILNIIENENLRNKLIEKGFERAKDFQWSDAADRLLAILRVV